MSRPDALSLAQILFGMPAPTFAGGTRHLLGSAEQQAGRDMALAAVETGRRDPNAIEAVTAALAAKFGNRLVTSLAVRQ